MWGMPETEFTPVISNYWEMDSELHQLYSDLCACDVRQTPKSQGFKYSELADLEGVGEF